MMTKERSGEIARMLIKYQLKKKGIQLGAMRRELENVAKTTDISNKEIVEFVQEIACELLAELAKQLVRE